VFYGQGPEVVPGDFEALYPAIFRNVGYVGDEGWIDLLRVGPAGRFVNREVDELDLERQALRADWAVDQQDQLDDTGRAVLPIAISGRIDADGAVALPNQVLVALDGVIAGVGDLDREDGGFAALLDERRLTPGSHEVALYLPTADGTVQRIVRP
jgi:hypothetical protein